VNRLRQSWLCGPALLWDEIFPISEIAVSQIDKRVAAALCESFFQFSQLLCSLEVLMLQRVKGSTELEKTLLGIEKLFIHGPNYFRRLGVVSESDDSFTDVDSAIDCAHRATNQRVIHGGLPIGESSGVGTADSTDLEAPDPIPPDQDNKILIGPTDI